MKAIQLVRPTVVELRDLPQPKPAAGEVLLKVTAAGLCHTDISIQHEKTSLFPAGLVLGHEIAGIVDSVGEGVTGWAPGDAAIVHPCWSCGACPECVAGRQNACRRTTGRLASPPTPGVSVNGGMAEYVAVPARTLIAADGLDPAVAAILPDAALVPYHSIHATRDLLVPGSTLVIIGLGGLGNLGVQIARALTAARIVAIDGKPAALQAVEGSVDLALPADAADLEQRILDFTGGQGAQVVLDFVGIDATLRLAAGVVARYGAIRVPGLGEGTLPFEARHAAQYLPWGASITRPYSGTYQDLVELVALARQQRIKPIVRRYPFEDAMQAFEDLAAGKIVGRAVLQM
ncbi:alcohol dehydrogenase catalytic domain-containing protein [Pseudomonas typographi]|uniref:alcohol dehydrogenase catalytic domain-containing protein n=1 Tax=Pseudomonas typographi TaxID=2715964 RepID=UPI0016836936|nr:alcohol dehydrogenase catalytic domain-containing protein [Pseudomonas typographi]MBD1551433.1 alcohol dehydrogenase catalytic domain-containing protein [Pseudomonas typographi]